MTNLQLQELVAQLRDENDALRAQADSVRQPEPPDTQPLNVDGDRGRPRGRAWGWTLLATVLIVIGAILAPVAVVANWARAELSDTDTFVATFAPLAKDPAVQTFVTDQVVTTIDKQVDVRGITSDVFDGIADLGLGPRATKALDALKGPAASGITSLMRQTVSKFVRSDTFASIWWQTLRSTHKQLIATMQNDPKAIIGIAANGEIGIQLGPVISQVKTRLVDQGLTFARLIPQVDKTIVIAKSDAIAPIQSLYALTIAVGAWLQWLALLFLVVGVIVARRKSLALVWAAVGLALSMIALLAALGIGRAVFVASVSPSVMPANTATTLYAQLIDFMQASTVAVAVLAGAVAVVSWLAGPFRIPRRMRALFSSATASIRALGDRYRLSTGSVGGWLYRQRVLARVLIAAIGAAIVLFARPLTPGMIIWTVVLCGVAIGVLELVQRPDAAADVGQA